MKISDAIQLLGVGVSLLIALGSQRQTRKSIESANRPYLSLYVETLDTVGGGWVRYIVLKNFGKSAAKITKLSFNTDLDKKNKDRKLSSLINATVAPGQKFSSSMDKNFKNVISGTLSYKDPTGKKFNESFTLKPNLYDSLLATTTTNSGDSDEANAIRQATHVLLKNFK